MKRTLKAGLLASASLAAITLMVASPARAFDDVDWRWDLKIHEHINTNVNVNIDIDPTGLVLVEALQINAGDVKAKSIIDGIYNYQPSSGGTVDLGSTDIQFHYGIGGGMLNDGFQSPNVSAGNVNETDQQPNINGTVTATVDLGTVEVPATAALNAEANLPSVISAATAVANNMSVASEVGVQLHVGQFAFGGGSSPAVNTQSGGGNHHGGNNHGGGSDNSNLTLADTLTNLVLGGDLVKANVKATSKVSDILNATVDSSATAVGNNLSVSVEPVSASNALVMADITQFSYADVTAKSKVTGVSINNYSGLGSLTRPVVNSVATAVGNNASISVKTPVVAAP